VTGAYRRPTIHDVAARSGVSKSTVSNVIRGAGGASAQTRARVQAAVEELGYRPNAAARNLVQRRTNLIGVLVWDLANAFDAELVKRIEQHASARSQTTIVCNTAGRPELEASRIEALLEQRVDGIALLDFTGDRAVLSRLFADRVPVVMASCWADYADCVAVDDQAGVDLAVEHLVGLGHERIGYVSQPFMAAATTRTRAGAFERALLRRGLEPCGEWTLDDGDGFVNAVRAERPSALVAATDHVAMRIIERLEAAGVRVPSDVSLVGFDGIAVGALSRIALTTVVQPADDLARQAVALLFNRIERGHDAAPEQHRLAPQLVLRGSTAPPPSRGSSFRSRMLDR
jgi:DNA-binding LacI/PurR family transcriptional regulator